MKIYEEVKLKLEQHPSFRERKLRCDKLAILALRKNRIEYKYKEGTPLRIDELVDFARTYDSYRHEYDAVQKDYEHLRGSDYDDKTKLVQQKQMEFGYESGYYTKLNV